MNKKLLQYIGALVGLALFVCALLVLRHEFRQHGIGAIMRHLRAMPAEAITLALTLTALDYLVLTGYDSLSLIYVKRPLGYPRTAFASFVGYSFSHNMGFSLFSGGGVRYRLYSAWGLPGVDIAKIVVFNGITLWMGFMAIAGVVFVTEPPMVPEVLSPYMASLRPAGSAALGIVVSYALLCIVRKGAFRLGAWEFEVPSLRLCASQLLVSSLDWCLAGSVLYVLLPPSSGLTYTAFMGVFLLAQASGIMSHVPGGLGVFEVVMVVFLANSISAPGVLGAVLMFRGVYYVLPFCIATALLGIHEARSRYPS